jgi:uncharacterized small protein (DUF1192 family)
MRAKEYIAINEQRIKYLDDIKRVISGLYPIRNNEEATYDYHTCILISDWGYKQYEEDLYNYEINKKNGVLTEKPISTYNEGEIQKDIAPEFRKQLLEIVKNDKSFGYLFFHLQSEQNWINPSFVIDCIPNKQEIEEAIKEYKDDYPKDDLDDYLSDGDNYDIYMGNMESTDTNEDWLDIFNTVYYLFDIAREKMHKPTQACDYIKNWYNESSILHKEVIFYFLTVLFKDYDYDLSPEQEEQMGHIFRYINIFFNDSLESLKSKENNEEIKKKVSGNTPSDDADKLKERISELEQQLTAANTEIERLKVGVPKKGVFTTNQQVLCFYYLFDKLGINFGNSDRALMIRFIHSFTGKNEQDIKEKLNFEFGDKKTKQDLRIVAENLKELMPSIAIKIENDNKE